MRQGPNKRAVENNKEGKVIDIVAFWVVTPCSFVEAYRC
jgi:hypothetical protein